MGNHWDTRGPPIKHKGRRRQQLPQKGYLRLNVSVPRRINVIHLLTFTFVLLITPLLLERRTGSKERDVLCFLQKWHALIILSSLLPPSPASLSFSLTLATQNTWIIVLVSPPQDDLMRSGWNYTQLDDCVCVCESVWMFLCGWVCWSSNSRAGAMDVNELMTEESRLVTCLFLLEWLVVSIQL